MFTIPISNGHLERCFSHMKILKTNKRSSLGEEKLDGLLQIHFEGPPPNQWSAKSAVQLWWNDKTRRPNRSSKSCSFQSASIILDSEDEEEPQLNLYD